MKLFHCYLLRLYISVIKFLKNYFDYIWKFPTLCSRIKDTHCSYFILSSNIYVYRYKVPVLL